MDYESLRIIWWLLLGVLLAGFAIMDGFDMGVGMLLPWLTREDNERRIIINTVGPVWEGNQVWLVLGAGAIFAAWPIVYAVTFSGFYFAMFLALSGLIIRPVAFKFRSKRDNPAWRKRWDRALFFGGFIPALIFGVAVGNVIHGVPFYFDSTLRSYYTGSFFSLLNPFSIFIGLMSVLMMMTQGGCYLVTKLEGALQKRVRKCVAVSALLLLGGFIAGGFWVQALNGLVALKPILHNAPSYPGRVSMAWQPGAWLNNYALLPKLWLVPGVAALSMLLTSLLIWRGQGKLAMITSSLQTLLMVATVGVTIFPALLPSSSNPNMSLLVWNASSSPLTLGIMLIATIIFMPLILLYTAWVYRVLKGKVNLATITRDSYTAY